MLLQTIDLQSRIAHFFSGLHPGDWLQFAGTILAAIVAIVGAFVGVVLGNRNARKVQREEAQREAESERDRKTTQLQATLQAIRAEFIEAWTVYAFQIGKNVEQLDPKNPILPGWSCNQNYFVVFEANAAALGAIENEPLRTAIVRNYILGKGLIDTFTGYNPMAAELFARQRNHGNFQGGPADARLEESVKEYTQTIARQHHLLKKVIANLRDLFDEELDLSKTSLPLIDYTVTTENIDRLVARRLVPRRAASDGRAQLDR
jgi:hypothetical protein